MVEVAELRLPSWQEAPLKHREMAELLAVRLGRDLERPGPPTVFNLLDGEGTTAPRNEFVFRGEAKVHRHFLQDPADKSHRLGGERPRTSLTSLRLHFPGDSSIPA